MADMDQTQKRTAGWYSSNLAVVAVGIAAVAYVCGLLILTAKSEKKEISRYCAKGAVASLDTSEIGVSIALSWQIHATKILLAKPTT